jgi:GntR family transcriptional regulator, transcriptional repressor for pyruvate dehydrogenase complex
MKQNRKKRVEKSLAPAANACQSDRPGAIRFIRSMRPKRVAEMIAGELRDRILSGALRDGDRIPKEDQLLTEFPVAKASMREAMRILETEGLIAVQRGAKGGAIVRTPKAANAAYMLGLVLSAQGVPLEDVARGIRQLEPMCALLCAERADRARSVVPRLRRLQKQAEKALDNPILFSELTRLFHEEIVASCGNETLKLIVGTLETLWSRHVLTAAHEDNARGRPQTLSTRRRALEEHLKILDAIEAGDAMLIREMLLGHLDRVQQQRAPSPGQRISVDALRS